MRIAIPTMSDNFNGRISARFGRAPYFAIVDKCDRSVSFIANSYCANELGAGKQLINLLASMGVETIATHEIGLKVYQLSNQQQIQLLLLPDEITEISGILSLMNIKSEDNE